MKKIKYCTCKKTKDEFGGCVPDEKGECVACKKKITKNDLEKYRKNLGLIKFPNLKRVYSTTGCQFSLLENQNKKLCENQLIIYGLLKQIYRIVSNREGK